MLGAVCHDLGKPPTTAFVDGRIRSIDHEQAGVAPATAVLDRLNVHTHRRLRRAQAGPRHRRAPPEAGHVRQVEDAGVGRRVPAAGAEGRPRAAGAAWRSRTAWAAAASFDCSAMDWFLERARQLGVEHAPPAPLVLGRHLLALGVQPGPRMGEILRAVYEQQLDGTVTTVDEGLAFAREYNRALMLANRLCAALLLRLRCLMLPRHRRQRPGSGAAAASIDEPIGRFVVDARGALPRFKAIRGQSPTALGVETDDLPDRGLGLVVGAHVYPVRKAACSRWASAARCCCAPAAASTIAAGRRGRPRRPDDRDQPDGDLAAGVAELRGAGRLELPQRRHRLGIVHDRARGPPRRGSPSRARGSFNYGGGARWFTKKHLAFTFDLRFYTINAQEAGVERPAYPRVDDRWCFSAGISIR